MMLASGFKVEANPYLRRLDVTRNARSDAAAPQPAKPDVTWQLASYLAHVHRHFFDWQRRAQILTTASQSLIDCLCPSLSIPDL